MAANCRPTNFDRLATGKARPTAPTNLLPADLSTTYFFFEFIERREAARGFGEGNFLALYQAVEAELERRC